MLNPLGLDISQLLQDIAQRVHLDRIHQDIESGFEGKAEGRRFRSLMGFLPLLFREPVKQSFTGGLQPLLPSGRKIACAFGFYVNLLPPAFLWSKWHHDCPSSVYQWHSLPRCFNLGQLKAAITVESYLEKPINI